MLAIMGTYENGVIKLEEEPEDEGFSEVIVTFLKKKKDKRSNDMPKRLKWEDFNFEEARKITSKCKTSFSDTLIEERRSEL